MTKFNLKEHIAKNKATFFGSLTEGQFSWMTQDTGQQIGSQDENMIPVYMFDDKGKYYYENDYEGYGVFGGMDYYELLDKMNGGIGDRSEGIRKAFDKPAVAAGKVLFPALVTDPYKFNYKTHDFTQEAETDPNQSWYEPEEDDDDYIMGNDDDDYVNRYGDEDEDLDEGKAAYEYEKGKEAGEKIEKKKMKKSELKAKIKEMVLAEYERDVDYTDETAGYDFLAELEGMLDEADETEKDTAEVDTTDVAVDDTETVTTSTEVEVDPDVKAVQDALTQAQVAAQKLGDKKLTDQIGNTITFFTREHVVEKPKAAVAEEASTGIKENQSSSPKLLDFVDGDDRKTLSTYKMLGFEVEVDDEVNNVYFAEMDFKGYDWMAVLAVLEDCQREGVKPNMIWNDKNYSFDEAMELADNKAASDIMDDDGVGTKLEAKSMKKSVNENTGETLEIKTPEDLKKVEGSQIFKYDVFDKEDFEQYKVYVLADDKSQAEKIAKEKFPKQFPPYKLDTGYPQKSSAAENLWTGKEKNSFWYGVEKTGAVAENLKETLLLQKRAGIITEAQYKEKLNEASKDEVPLTSKVKSFINKAIADSKKDEEFENLKKADWFENELIDELIDLFPVGKYDSASKEVMDYIKDKIK